MGPFTITPELMGTKRDSGQEKCFVGEKKGCVFLESLNKKKEREGEREKTESRCG